MFFILHLTTLVMSWALSDDIIVLPQITRDRSAGEILIQDPLRPSLSGRTQEGVDKSIIQKTSLPTHEVGQPGNLTQVRGLGRSSDDTDVRAFGIPLNPPQGGGFDFSVFPTYFWSSFDYQPGSFDGGIETRAKSGQILLTPWTKEALNSNHDKIKISQLYSTIEQSQTSVGASRSGEIAALIGLSVGKMNGPTGSVSGAFGEGSFKGQYHLIGSSVESKIKGSNTTPTPNTKQYNARLIPVLETEKKFGQAGLLKSTFFFDGQFNRYNSPDLNIYSRDHIFQVGTENAFTYGSWSFGTGAKHIKFAQVGFKAPDETVTHIQAAYLYKEDQVSFDPRFGINHVTRYGVTPSFSLGAKYDYAKDKNYFSRVGFSERVPSMIDRFYQSAFVKNNPDLLPEKTWTGVFGWNMHVEKYEHTLQLIVQRSQDVQMSQLKSGLYVPTNAGMAYVGSIMDYVSLNPMDWLYIQNALTLSYSFVEKTASTYPYLPVAHNNLGLEWRQTGDQPRWTSGVDFRTATSANVTSRSDKIGSYALTDIKAKYIFSKVFEVTTKVENITNRKAELVKDYPLPGRTFVVAAQGIF